MLKNKDLLGLKDLPKEEIELILKGGAEMKKILDQNIKKLPHLSGKNIVTLFYEPSTRTRTSFEMAAKFMSATVSSIAVAQSSVQKGETLIDTGKTLDALLTDVIIIRHSKSGAAQHLAKNVRASVINGGDGMNEHPTQALLDLLSLRERFGTDLSGLKVVISGDIKHSRVAKSNIYGMQKLGINVAVAAPKTLLPTGIEQSGVQVYTNLDEALVGANAVMALRLQLERQQAGLIAGSSEFRKYYGLTSERLQKADDLFVMHPGPINRGVEIDSCVADADNSAIERQVTNGLAIRMAVLFLLTRK